MPAAKTQRDPVVAGNVRQSDLDKAQATAERTQRASEARRKANEDAYQASIEGEELPPSVIEAQKVDAEREREAKADAEAAQQDMAETTEKIASRPNNPPDQR